MNALTLFLAVFAVWEILEIWHHSALFATWRARVELWNNKLGEALRCMFCLAPWIALLASAYLVLTAALLPPGYQTYAQIPVAALAVARLANLGNDVCRRFTRTPKMNTLPPNGGDKSEEP